MSVTKDKNMRVGILTLMHGYNYGGLLQCFSLQQALENLGHQVEIIDYHPRPGWRKLRRFGGWFGSIGDKLIVDGASAHKYKSEVHAKFQGFRRTHLKLSSPCNTLNGLRRLMTRYDAMVVGSDQVWNLDWTIPEYFFSFATGYKGLLISYAACCGHRVKAEQDLDDIGRWLERLDAISVRNTMTQKFVKKSCGRDSIIVVDPTLLIDLSELASPPPVPFDDNYILLYGLSEGRYRKAIDSIKSIATEKGLPVVAIKSDILQDWDMSAMDYCLENPSLEEWLWMFQNATLVLTDSFHGTLFSIKNRVPFVNYIGKATSSERVAYIAHRYGLSEGYCSPDSIKYALEQDFDAIMRHVTQHVNDSKDFLTRILGKVK